MKLFPSYLGAAFVFFNSLFSIGLSAAPPVEVRNIRIEGMASPMGVDNINPLMSWQSVSDQRNIIQSGYHVIVSSSLFKLNKNIGDVWNSGHISSPASVNVRYPLSNLLGGKEYFWKVRVFTNAGASSWSGPSKWSMGIMDTAFWRAKWIGTEKVSVGDDPFNIFTRLSARYLRKEIYLVQKPKRAIVYICGLGLYELYVNGKKIGTDVLTPALKQYDKAVPYHTIDLTRFLVAGKNAIGCILGNGRYFPVRHSADGGIVNGTPPSAYFGFPKLFLQGSIEYADGKTEEIMTDDTWKVSTNGPILSNNEFDGEEYDARKEFNGWSRPGYRAEQWEPVAMMPPPSGKLVTQFNENIRQRDSLKPLSVKLTSRGTCLLDMGQNMVGWLKIHVKGNPGDTVTMRFAETITNDDSLYLANIRGAKVTDKYIFKSSRYEEWEPTFVYHGFRYVEVSGLQYLPDVKDFTGKVIYDDLPAKGNFETSNKVVNRIYKNAYWSIIGNYRSIPTDCPQRDERMGWLGDRAVNSYGESFLFDNSRFYAKWMDDIRDAQKEDGSIPDVAPAFWKVYTDNVTWPITYLVIPDMLRKQFGDTTTMRKHYPHMKKWILYMWEKYQQDNLVMRDTYGDWCLPPESLDIIFSKDSTRNTSGSLIGSAYYYYGLCLMYDFTRTLNIGGDSLLFRDMAEKVKSAFNTKFYHADSGYYANNTVTSNLLPLTFGLVPQKDRAKVFSHIVKRTTGMYNDHVSTGLIGGQWLMRGLSENGKPDMAFTIATNTTYPSWGYMAGQGATSVWELWNGNTADPSMNSGNHVMLLGDLMIWLYENLAGIKSDNTQVAFKKIIMHPYVDADIKWVNAKTSSPYGDIKSSWKKDNNILQWHVQVPGNSCAELIFPVNAIDRITESSVNLQDVKGIRHIRHQENKISIEVGSGDFYFECKL